MLESVRVVYGLFLTHEEVLSIKNLTEDELADFGWMGDEPFVDEYRLFTWPCCSSLNREQFILGKLLKEYNLQTLFDEVIEYNNVEKPPIEYDSHLVDLAEKYKVPCKIKTIILGDDCGFCS